MGRYVQYNEEELRALSDENKEKGNYIVLATGTFDPCHASHRLYLQYARSFGRETLGKKLRFSPEILDDRVALFVNVKNEERVSLEKGLAKPVFSEMQRTSAIADLQYVDYVTVHPAYDQKPVIALAKVIDPDLIVFGYDGNEKGFNNHEKRKIRDLLGYEVKFGSAPKFGDGSSSMILEELCKPRESVAKKDGLRRSPLTESYT